MAGWGVPPRGYPVMGASTGVPGAPAAASNARGPPAPPPVASTVPESQQWAEHKAADGRPYWYNAHTKESVWVKPAALKSHAELLLSTCPWKEFTNAQTGRKYYYNSKTQKSVWEKPKELAEVEALAGVGDAPAKPASVAPAAPASSGAVAAVSTTKPAEVPVPVAGPVTYATKEEAQAAFQQLLSDMKVSADWSWERVRRVVGQDPRYEALKREGERKQTFNAWKPIRRREQQEESRLAAKEKLAKLKALMMIVDEIGIDTDYRQAAEILRSHEYFQAVKVDRDRQAVLEDVIKEKLSQIKEAENAEKRVVVEKVKTVLATLPGISAESRFDNVRPTLKEMPQFQPGGELAECHDLHLLDAFVDYTEGLGRSVDDSKRVDGEADRRALRHAREGFEALLGELERKGTLHAGSLWKEHYKTISGDPRYDTLLTICRKNRQEADLTPLDLFKVRVDELKDPLREGKQMLSRIMADVGYKVTSKTELKDFHEHLCGDTRYVNVSSDAVRMAHLEFVREAEAAEQQAKEDAERAVTQRRARFLDMLERGLRKFTREQNWAEVATIFAREGDFNAVEDPDMREALFMEFVASNPWTSRGSRRDDDRGHRRSSYDGDRDRGRKHGRSRSRSPPRRTRRRSHSPSSGESDMERSSRRSPRDDRDRDRDRDRRKKRKKEKKEKKDKKKKRRHEDDASDDDIDPAKLLEKRTELLSQLNK